MKIAKQTSYCINVLSPIFFLCSISIVSNASPNPPVWLYYPNQGDNQQVGSHHSVGKKAKCAARTSGCASAQPHLPESSLCRLEKNFPLLSQKMWWLTYVPYYEIQTFKNRCAIPNSVTLKKKKKRIFGWIFLEDSMNHSHLVWMDFIALIMNTAFCSPGILYISRLRQGWPTCWRGRHRGI